ncbi:MAG: hypothetical protein R2733_14810 [Acidimicrobiales bacterium]
MASMVATKIKPITRAVVRLIEAGSMVDCAYCEKQLKFRARQRDLQVICNVYEDGRWDRVEHFHAECYAEAGEPHGDAND